MSSKRGKRHKSHMCMYVNGKRIKASHKTMVEDAKTSELERKRHSLSDLGISIEDNTSQTQQHERPSDTGLIIPIMECNDVRSDSHSIPKHALSMPTQKHEALSLDTVDFQVHLFWQTKNRTSFQNIATVIFPARCQDAMAFLGSCTGPGCHKFSGYLALYQDTENSILDSTLQNIEYCPHTLMAFSYILKENGYSLGEYTSEQLQKALAQVCVCGAPKKVGVFMASQQNSNVIPAVVVTETSSVFLVQRYSKSWYCATCRKGMKAPCLHLQACRGLLEETGQDSIAAKVQRLNREVEDDFSCNYVLSKALIQMDSIEQKELLYRRQVNYQQWMYQTYEYNAQMQRFQVGPKSKRCGLCGGITKQINKHMGLLIGPVMVEVAIYSTTCSTSHCEKSNILQHYDGTEDAVINFDNKFFFTSELLKEYLIMYSNSGIALNAWWRSKCMMQTILRSELENYKILKRMEARRGDITTAIAGAAELYICESSFKCCDAPKYISLDGIVLSVTAIRMPQFTEPWILEGETITRTTRPQERQLDRLNLTDKQILEALLQSTLVVGSKNLVMFIDTKVTSIALKVVLLLAKQTKEMKLVCCPKAIGFAKFIKAHVAPVASLIPYICRQALRSLVHGQFCLGQQHSKLLYQKAPVFLQLVASIQSRIQKGGPHTERLIIFAKELFELLEERLEATYSYHEKDLYRKVSEQEHASIPECFKRKCHKNPHLNELWSTGMYFPHFPIHQQVREVKINKETKKEGIEKCDKKLVTGATCGPGVVLVYCLEHQICIGFVVLKKPESPKTVYELLMTRFPVVPELVLYDNACNLFEYVLNRTPRYLRHTLFLVDSFHYESHKNCGPTFNSFVYDKLTRLLNTSLTEQRNSLLARLKVTVPRQRARVFFAFLRYVVAMHNERQKKVNQSKEPI